MSGRRINFDSTIHLGHVFTAAAVAVAVATSLSISKAKDGEQDRRISSLEELAASNQIDIARFGATMGRVDERTSSIAALLGRIEERQAAAEQRELDRLTRERENP